MADTLDDGEFWLPPQFLADDDNTFIQTSSATTNKNPNQSSLSSSNPLQFGSFNGFSDFTSPNESSKSLSEAESDEEDYLAGLTLRMARSTIDDGFDSDNPKARGFSGSPQSTLCDMGSGSGCSQGSSRGSPKGNSKVPSPPATWDLLHAAAGEVARMRINDTHGVRQVPVPVTNSISAAVYHQKLQAMQHFQRLQQQRQMIQNGIRGSRGMTSPTWLPPPPPQQAAGMRPLFLGTQGGNRECAGTGVFLPRHAGNRSEPRQKPACSTVLVPARVMQALNLNLDDICSQPHLQPVAGGRLNSDADVLLKLQINRGAIYQKRNHNNNRRQPPTDHEIKLPQEWTY